MERADQAEGDGLKAQISAEYLFVVSMLVLLFLVFYTVYHGGEINLFQAHATISSMRNAYAVSAAINSVHLAGDGAEYNFTLSGKIDEENITLSEFGVESRRGHAASQAPLLNGNVNRSTLEGGEMIIKNNKGEIEIEQ